MKGTPGMGLWKADVLEYGIGYFVANGYFDVIRMIKAATGSDEPKIVSIGFVSSTLFFSKGLPKGES